MKLRVTGTNNHWNGQDYLTIGKTYEAEVSGGGFNLVDNDGDTIFVLPRCCAHGFTYEIVEQQENTMKQENFVTVGETYKSLNGEQWTCIFVDGDLAWCKAGKDHTAYVWKTDGTPVSLPEQYTIKPNKTVVELFGAHKIMFEVDSSGEPVVDTVRMEKL